MPILRHLAKLFFILPLLLIGKVGFALTGDCNGDSVVDRLDSNLVANVLVGNQTTIPNRADCDVNLDGKIDLKDALTILQFTSGLLPNLGGTDLQVLGMIPLDGAGSIPVSSPIHLFFSNSISPTGDYSSVIRLTDQSTGQTLPVQFAFSQQNLIVSLLPVQPLSTSMVYQVTISTGMRDGAGGQLRHPLSQQFTTAAPGNLVLISGNGQSGEINSLLGTPLEVEAQDTTGAPVAGIPVTFKANLGDGKFVPSGLRDQTVATDNIGRAAISFQLGGQATQQSVEAAAPGFKGLITYSAMALSGPAQYLRITTGNNQTCAVDGPVGVPLVVRAMDAGGNGVIGTTVTFRMAQGSGDFDGGLLTAMKLTDQSGAAQTGFTCRSSGTLRVQADFPGLQGQALQFSHQALPPSSSNTTAVLGTVISDTDLRPIQGIKVYVLSDPGNVVLTDSYGNFRIEPAPLGLQTVKIDAMNSSAANSLLYADLAYEITVVKGQINNLIMPVLLPELDIQSTLDVTAAQGGTLSLRANPGWQLYVQPGQAIFPNGTRTGKLWVTSVPIDKVPMPPADGKYASVFVAVEPPMVKFNPPAQVTFPNVDNIPAGTVIDIVSFDHNIGRFLPIGKGKVSDDGAVITSLPGSGLVHGGWHYAAPPVPSPTTCVTGRVLSHSGQCLPSNCTATVTGQSSNLDSQCGYSICNVPASQPISPIVNCPDTDPSEDSDGDGYTDEFENRYSHDPKDAMDYPDVQLSISPLQLDLGFMDTKEFQIDLLIDGQPASETVAFTNSISSVAFVVPSVLTNAPGPSTGASSTRIGVQNTATVAVPAAVIALALGRTTITGLVVGAAVATLVARIASIDDQLETDTSAIVAIANNELVADKFKGILILFLGRSYISTRAATEISVPPNNVPNQIVVNLFQIKPALPPTSLSLISQLMFQGMKAADAEVAASAIEHNRFLLHKNTSDFKKALPYGLRELK